MQELIKVKETGGNLRQRKREIGQEPPISLRSLEFKAEEGGRDLVIKAYKQRETVPTL